MTQLTIVKPDSEDFESDLIPVVASARALDVTDETSHAAGLHLLQDITGYIKRVKLEFAPAKKAAHEAHREITGLESRLIKPGEEARRVIERKLTSYENEARRIAAAEAQAAAEAARKLADERRLAEAIEAEAAGDAESAEAILDAPLPAVPTVAARPAVATVEGVAAVKRWSAEVVDAWALLQYVAQTPEWVHLVKWDMVALNGLARSQREAMRIPGVKAVCAVGRAVRS